MSIDEALNTALSLTGTLQAAVNIAGERVSRLFGMDAAAATAAEEAAAAAKTVLENLENPTGLFASIYGKKQHEKPKAEEEEPGLLAPRRKLQVRRNGVYRHLRDGSKITREDSSFS